MRVNLRHNPQTDRQSLSLSLSLSLSPSPTPRDVTCGFGRATDVKLTEIGDFGRVGITVKYMQWWVGTKESQK